MLPNTPGWLDAAEQSLYDGTVGPYGSPAAFECWILNRLARDAKNVLEIGSWRGRSACFLSSGLNEGRTLTCVDWFQGDPTGGADASEELTRQALAKHQLEAKIINCDMLAADWGAIIDDVDLLFYDADHRCEPTCTVLESVHAYLNSNARVVLHDANFESTREAINQMTAKGLYRTVATVECWQGLELMVRISNTV